jgi:FtsZ-interacting cell division protein YlmF
MYWNSTKSKTNSNNKNNKTKQQQRKKKETKRKKKKKKEKKEKKGNILSKQGWNKKSTMISFAANPRKFTTTKIIETTLLNFFHFY